MNMTSPRPYRMVARAANVVATGERILDATVEAFWKRPSDQISLDDVARRSGVSVQTVIRRFRGKDGLLAAAIERDARPQHFEHHLKAVDLSARLGSSRPSDSPSNRGKEPSRARMPAPVS